jgi:isopenicillin-N epimerase
LLDAAGAEAYEGAGESGSSSVQPIPDLRGNWQVVRDLFELRRDRIYMASFLLAFYPRPVRDAIETHRRGLDEDPVGYFNEHGGRLWGEVFAGAAEYLAANQAESAMTDSTTMGLGLLFGGIRLREGQEILTTVHDHYAMASSLRLRAERTGAAVRGRGPRTGGR